MRSGWREVTVEEVAKVVGGGTPKSAVSEFWGGDVQWLTPKDLSDRPARYTSTGARRLTAAGLEGSGATLLPAGAVLLTSRAPVGYVSVASGPLATNQGFKSLVLDETQVPEFWYYLLGHSTDYLRANSGGSTFKELSGGALKTLRFVIPPLTEQRRVVDLVGTLDDTIARAEKAQGAADDTLANLADYELETAEGRLVRLGDVMTVVRGGSPRPIANFYTNSPDGLNWVRIGDVGADGKYITKTEKRILRSGLNKTRTVEPGDFILSNSMSFGRPYIMRIAGCIHDGWLKLSDFQDSLDEDYLYYLLRSRHLQGHFERLAAGSSVRNLNKEKVAGIEVVLPNLETQRSIAARMDRLFDALHCHDSVIDRLRTLRSNLLGALLSGAHEIPESYDKVMEDEAA